MSGLCFIALLTLRHYTVSFHPMCVYIIFAVPCSSQSSFTEEVWLLQNHLVFVLLWRSGCCCHVSAGARTLLSAGILCHNKHVSKSTPLFIDSWNTSNRVDTCFYYHEDSASAFMVFIPFHLIRKVETPVTPFYFFQLSFYSVSAFIFCLK